MDALWDVLPMFFFLLVFYFVLLGVGVTSYVLQGIAIMKMSQNRGIPNGFLGFIPYANIYQLGRVAGEVEIGKKKMKNTGVWLLVLPIAFAIVMTIGMLIIMVPFIVQSVSLGYHNAYPEEFLAGPFMAFFVSLMIFTVVMVLVEAVLYVFQGLVFHKIFSRYADGQKPVYYTLLSLFVPLAFSILLFKFKDKPLLPGAPVE